MKKLYIAVLDSVPDNMVPVLVAHAVLTSHIKFNTEDFYREWITSSFRKCVVRVNKKEFEKIRKLQYVSESYENKTLNGEISCLVVPPYYENIPNVLAFSQLWRVSDNHGTYCGQ